MKLKEENSEKKFSIVANYVLSLVAYPNNENIESVKEYLTELVEDKIKIFEINNEWLV